MFLASSLLCALALLVCARESDGEVGSRQRRFLLAASSQAQHTSRDSPADLLQAAKAPFESAKIGTVAPHRYKAFSAVGVQEAIQAPDGCVTREDVRAQAWFSKTAAIGSKCLFKVDPRDEATHCIPELEYGSNGWCFTKSDKSEWGSCADSCSLYGPPSVLGSIIDVLNQNLDTLIPAVDAAGLPKSGGGAEQPTQKAAEAPAKAAQADAAPTAAAKAATAPAVVAKTADSNKAALQEAKMSAMVAAKQEREAEYDKKLAVATASQALLELKGPPEVDAMMPSERRKAREGVSKKAAGAKAAQAMLDLGKPRRQEAPKDVMLMQLRTAKFQSEVEVGEL